MAPASAHPLGNATVNHYDGLQLTASAITDTAVEDVAEIPTFQRRSSIDRDHDGTLSAGEASAYGAARCAALAASERLTVGGGRLAWRVGSSAYAEKSGAVSGLMVGRLECRLTAEHDLSGGARVTLSDSWDGAGIGWHEITAVASGVSLHSSPVPATSISNELRAYPNDLLSSPLDVRSAALDVQAGGSSTYAAVKRLPVAGFAVRALDRLSRGFNDLVGRKHLGVGVAALALLLAMVLGAGHAFLPGHGKTVMAAYLVGRKGRLRDVATVGATVTLTHTLGVLVLGLLIALGSQFATVVVEQDLAIVSGGTVALVGAGLLVSAVRRRRAERVSVTDRLAHLEGDTIVAAEALAELPATRVEQRQAAPVLALAGHATASTALTAPAREHPHHDHPHHPQHDHPHHPHHPHHPQHDHPHPGPADAASPLHRHGWGKPHAHGPAEAMPGSGFSRSGLIGLGAAGGLVPSPSALLVLLAAVTAGRTAFGVGLVLAYGLGMALALCAAGLLVVRLQHRLGRLLAGRRAARPGRARWFGWVSWVAAAMPVLTATLVLVVGLGLMARAISGSV